MWGGQQEIKRRTNSINIDGVLKRQCSKKAFRRVHKNKRRKVGEQQLKQKLRARPSCSGINAVLAGRQHQSKKNQFGDSTHNKTYTSTSVAFYRVIPLSLNVLRRIKSV